MSDLGNVPATAGLRDAFHVACLAAEAGTNLLPGRKVGFLPDGTVGSCDKPFGIVDPFKGDIVVKGELVWVVLFPGSVKSLRHFWQSDAVDADGILQRLTKLSVFTIEEMVSIFDDWQGGDYGAAIDLTADLGCNIEEFWRAVEVHTARPMNRKALTNFRVQEDDDGCFNC